MLRANRHMFDNRKTGGPATKAQSPASSAAPAGTAALASRQFVPHSNKWIYRGNVLMSRGDMIGAISEFSQALLSNQRDIDAYVGRGKAFTATGGYDLAQRDLNTAIALAPESAQALAARGGLYYELSTQRIEDKQMLLDAALEDLNKAVSIDPSCAEAYKHRSMVYAALDGNVLETSRGSRAVYDAYLSLTLNPGYAPAKA